MSTNFKSTRTVKVGKIFIGGGNPLVLIAGPCVIESENHALKTAESLKKIAEQKNISLIYKSSWDKANRSSIKKYRGPGLKEGLRILERIKQQLELPILSDVHAEEQIIPSAEILDILQIPAFLCRQTDLLIAAAKTEKTVNIKKGQFMAPWDMKNVVTKIQSEDNQNILLTERGVSFGYNNLVVDMRSLIIMREIGYPVVFDSTHSVQHPGGLGDSSGGQSEMVPYLTRGAIAVGCDALFIETHQDPENAPSDGANMLKLDNLPILLEEVKELDALRLKRERK